MKNGNPSHVNITTPELIYALMTLVRHADSHPYDKDCVGSQVAAMIPAEVRDMLSLLNEFDDAGYFRRPETVTILDRMAKIRQNSDYGLGRHEFILINPRKDADS